MGEWTGVGGLGVQVDDRVGGRARWQDDRWMNMRTGVWTASRAANRPNAQWMRANERADKIVSGQQRTRVAGWCVGWPSGRMGE